MVGTVWSVTNGQSMLGRVVSRAFVASVAGALVVAVTTAPASAATDVRAAGASAMPLIEVLGIFAGIPIALFVLITLLVLAPGLIRSSGSGSGQRGGLAEDGQPEWFGARPAAEVAQSESSAGRASLESASGSATEGSSESSRGGAGGSW